MHGDLNLANFRLPAFSAGDRAGAFGTDVGAESGTDVCAESGTGAGAEDFGAGVGAGVPEAQSSLSRSISSSREMTL